MNTQSNEATTVKKYEPHLSELKTDAEQIKRVRQIVLEADTLEEMLTDFDRFGVTKPMYFLQAFARSEALAARDKEIAAVLDAVEIFPAMEKWKVEIGGATEKEQASFVDGYEDAITAIRERLK